MLLRCSNNWMRMCRRCRCCSGSNFRRNVDSPSPQPPQTALTAEAPTEPKAQRCDRVSTHRASSSGSVECSSTSRDCFSVRASGRSNCSRRWSERTFSAPVPEFTSCELPYPPSPPLLVLPLPLLPLWNVAPSRVASAALPALRGAIISVSPHSFSSKE